MQDKIEGYVEHIVYRNEENGYTVLNLTVDGSEVTCVGTFQSVHEGEYMEAEGEYTEHPTYGQQFRASVSRIKIPQGGMALERYLGSGAVKGIGAALAARIVRRFGEDTLRIMEEEPERLAEIKGISERKAREIGEQMIEKAQMQNAMIFLAQYGISLNLGIKIYNQYQDSLYRVLKENPYKLAEDIQGVGFRIADEIAGRIGIRVDSEYRVKSGLYYVLSQAAAQGHLYLPKQELLYRTGELLGIESDILDKYLMDMAIDRRIVLKEEKRPGQEPSVIVYTSQAYYLELNTARMLQELNLVCTEEEEGVRRKIERIEKESGIVLDEGQRQAVAKAAENGLMILTGGPGTGKTTTINTMIRYFEGEGLEIALAAPTGRAAKRMTEATGHEASTVHRLLELSGAVDESSANVRFERNAENPLEADVIIVDEMSMVDIHLMHALLLAVVPGTRLILVGDMHQLPSVGPGSVLKDMIQSGAFPVVELATIFRQARESDIVVNAHKIQKGEKVRLDNKSRDFFFLKRQEIPVIQKVILTLISRKLPPYVGAAPQEIQVLTPMRKGPLGVERLNELLQKYLNPPAAGKPEKETGSGIFRQGDKVMQVKNNYQLEWEVRDSHGIALQKGMGVFNGDLGVITSINPYAELLTVLYDENRSVDYTFKQLDELELAYATTIHKAQGSEYPAVIIPLLGGPRMLMTRNLLYTAVTRARKCVVLTGSQETFQAMIENEMEENRYTTLAERIREAGEIRKQKEER
ncbi:MAG TPA: ATP-dependent RecD-like DNA helicase [Candidatus Scatomonas pullistercoris]|uniref:ATP-dependent RecD2 DNA helicase n=1 Tax=Candidatus Scatomonas pullistercoris TaxID=2840920 RepID=A0A9D1TAK8_9FIRM|nr:ATP-dependent RecD-like DNA helicase [Candidatus Scatomonas pullistercoris]